MKITGVLTSMSPQYSGSNDYGPWTVQSLTVKTSEGDKDVKVWNRPDFTSAKGKYISLDGVEEGKGKKKGQWVDVLEVKSEKADITITDRTPEHGTTPVPPSKSTPATTTSSSTFKRPTQAEYDAVIVHAIDFVHHAFSKHQNVVAEAIAEIVKGYMVAFAKGDFVVEPKEKPAQEKPGTPKAPINPDDIPF
jgi:hypothetical protein